MDTDQDDRLSDIITLAEMDRIKGVAESGNLDELIALHDFYYDENFMVSFDFRYYDIAEWIEVLIAENNPNHNRQIKYAPAQNFEDFLRAEVIEPGGGSKLKTSRWADRGRSSD